MTPTKPEARDVEQARAAAARIDNWDGADHFDDCPSRDHESHCCSCPDTMEGEEACEDLVESLCDCYLVAMRACRDSIRLLLSSHDRLTRFMELLEPDPADREALLSNPGAWAADYRHAMNQLAAVEVVETRANKLATENERLTREVERLTQANIRVRCCFAGVGQACPIHEARAIRESKPE